MSPKSTSFRNLTRDRPTTKPLRKRPKAEIDTRKRLEAESDLLDALNSRDRAVTALRTVSDGDPTADEHTRRLVAPVSGGSTVLVDAVRALDAQGVKVDDLALRRPTLDDVFLTLTGHAAEEEQPQPDTGRRGRARGRKES